MPSHVAFAPTPNISRYVYVYMYCTSMPSAEGMRIRKERKESVSLYSIIRPLILFNLIKIPSLQPDSPS